MNRRPPNFVIVSNDQGQTLNPTIHSDIDALALSPHAFATLAHSAYCARRTQGVDTTSHATAARACGMSVSTVRRERAALVDRRLLEVRASAPGKPASYALSPYLNWDRGCKLWLPQEIWAQRVSPHALRVYCHYVSVARGRETVVSDRESVSARCCLEKPTLRKVEAELASAGMIAWAGREQKHPVFALTPASVWVAPDDRQDSRYADLIRETETCEQGWKLPKRKRVSRVEVETETCEQGKTPKRKRVSTKSNDLIKTSNQDKKFFEDRKTVGARSEFAKLLGHENLKGFLYRLKRDGDPDEQLEGWVKTFGSDSLQRAWSIIQTTETALELNPVYTHPKNSRLINFCLGALSAEDPHALCELYKQATQPTVITRPLSLDEIPQPPPYHHVGRAERLRQRHREVQEERAA